MIFDRSDATGVGLRRIISRFLRMPFQTVSSSTMKKTIFGAVLLVMCWMRLYVDYCLDWNDHDPAVCDVVDQMPLFSNDLIQYFWDYDNFGLKLA